MRIQTAVAIIAIVGWLSQGCSTDNGSSSKDKDASTGTTTAGTTTEGTTTAGTTTEGTTTEGETTEGTTTEGETTEGTTTEGETTEGTTTEGETTGETTGDEMYGWATMNDTFKNAHMASVVLPAMAKLFQGFDAGEFGGFNCVTCHGPNMVQVGFKMPNGLFPIAEADIPIWSADGDIGTFMATELLPAFAPLIDGTPVDPVTGKGTVSCFTCHETK